MPLTKSFRETVLADMREHPDFARAMLREGVDSLISGELGVGKNILRDYVNATIGFDGLAQAVGLPPKSLMRMLSSDGNPQMRNLFEVIGALQRHAGIELHLAELPPPKKSRPKKRKAAACAALPEHAIPGKCHGCAWRVARNGQGIQEAMT